MESQKLKAFVQHMAREAVEAMIDDATLQEIKRADPNPTIKVFAIAHEGEAKGNAPGIGAVVLQYFRNVIAQIFDKLAIGTKVFHLHNADNSHDGRASIGKVVGKSLLEAGNRLKTLAAVWIDPAHKDKTLDVASIEANIGFIPDPVSGVHRAVEVESVTGIALADGRHESPGFPEATLLTAIQAFVVGTDPKQTPGRDEDKMEFDPKKVTKEQLASAIKEQGIKVDDLFSKSQIQASDEGLRMQQIIDNSQNSIRDLREKVGKAEARVVEVETTQRVSTAKTVFGTTATERKLTDKQKSFIEANLDSFKPSTEEAKDDATLRKGLDAWVDRQLDTFKRTAELFGFKDDTPPANNQQQTQQPPGTKTPTPAGDNKGTPTPDTSLSNPANNDFIPKDATA